MAWAMFITHQLAALFAAHLVQLCSSEALCSLAIAFKALHFQYQ